MRISFFECNLYVSILVTVVLLMTLSFTHPPPNMLFFYECVYDITNIRLKKWTYLHYSNGDQKIENCVICIFTIVFFIEQTFITICPFCTHFTNKYLELISFKRSFYIEFIINSKTIHE